MKNVTMSGRKFLLYLCAATLILAVLIVSGSTVVYSCWRSELLCDELRDELHEVVQREVRQELYRDALPSGNALAYSACSYYEEHLPVLMYHHIVADGKECNDMTITVSRLRKDLQWLTDHGYHTILPRELATGQTLPEKPVLLTFDDGYRSNYEYLYPLLQEYQAKAVISIIVYMQDTEISTFLSWDMCREMAASGLVEIASHSYRLHNLDISGSYNFYGPNGIQRFPGETDESFQFRVIDDIQKSYDRITECIGQPPTFFAFPFGKKEPGAEMLIQLLFPMTAVTVDGIADLRQGFQNLPRITVTMDKELSNILS